MADGMRIVSLASGSKGNCTVVEQGGAAVAIDCGICWREFKSRLDATFGGAPPQIAGVLVTHSHVDHVSGLRAVLRKLGVSAFANSMTAETVSESCGIPISSFAAFENGQPFPVGPFEVRAFSIPHDTSDPVGFSVAGELSYFHGTDVGTPLDSVGLKFSEADVATLESNHDPVMLRTSGRPPSLIQRIAGPRGHLSNDDAAEIVRRFAKPRLRTLALAHLSQDCNTPRLAEVSAREALCDAGHPDLPLVVLSQDRPVWIWR